MPESFEQFRERTRYIWNRQPQEGFVTAPGCAGKVSKTGRLLPFYGNTTIFDLHPQDQQWLAQIQNALYDACGDFLSERLDPQTFHVTLHDLLNGSDWSVLEKDVRQTMADAKRVIGRICRAFPWGVHVRAKCLMNMVNTSVVLVFEPENEENCGPLMQMYDWMQKVVNLSYPLTPHVTLAYFKPGEVGGEQIARLQRAIDEADVKDRIIHLDVNRLNACTFTDMNHYYIEKTDGQALERFCSAQAECYRTALSEIRRGKKQSHWMWYVFPQLWGLGRSFEAAYYGIASEKEARAYLEHPILGPRLVQIAYALERLEESNPTAVMGYPDDMKLCSCMTLFEAVGGGRVFSAVLEKFYQGKRDENTLRLLNRA